MCLDARVRSGRTVELKGEDTRISISSVMIFDLSSTTSPRPCRPTVVSPVRAFTVSL